MKRIGVIVGIVLSFAVVIGALVIAGDDNSGEAKGSGSSSSSSTTDASSDKAKVVVVQPGAVVKVSSGAPVPKSDKKDDKKDDDKKGDDQDDDDDDDDDNENEGKYEARKPFVGVSPSRAQLGKNVEFEVKGFAPKSSVVITITAKSGYSGPVIPSFSITTDKQGRGKVKVPAPAVGVFTVKAVQGSKSATTTLTVVKKK